MKIHVVLQNDLNFPNSPKENLFLEPISTFKFAGGWVTTISSELLKIAPIPKELGHYGLEDMFISDACNILRKMEKIHPQQFVIRNLVVGENHRYRNDSYIADYIKIIDKKNEYRNVAHANYQSSIEKWTKSL